jgi:hypothetical protein
MVPFDIKPVTKLEAAIQQVEAAIELFYAKRYAPAITLAAAAEGCLRWMPPSADLASDDDLPGIEPMLEIMKRGAKERYGKTEKEAIEHFNALAYWLKHKTENAPNIAEVTNFDAWSMIVRAVTKIEATHPGSESQVISGFVEFSRLHYSEILTRPRPVRRSDTVGDELP